MSNWYASFLIKDARRTSEKTKLMGKKPTKSYLR